MLKLAVIKYCAYTMKKIYLLAGIALLLSGCKKDTIQTLIKPTSAENEITAPDTKEYRQEEEASKMDGTYLSDTYLSNIQKRHSIYAAKDTESYIFGFTLHKDSLITKTPLLEGFSNHEGGINANLKFNPEKSRFENDLSRNGEFDYFTKPFVINFTEGKYADIVFKNPLKTERYRKVTDIESALRELIAGNYIEPTSNRRFTFMTDGTMKGVPGSGYFELSFEFQEGLPFDAIFMGDTQESKNQIEYHYKIEGNTLTLYNLTGNHEAGEYIIGKPAYILVKQ